LLDVAVRSVGLVGGLDLLLRGVSIMRVVCGGGDKYRIVLAVLNQAIVRVVGLVGRRGAGVVFECVVGGHVVYINRCRYC
jgi:hypothetical protein